MKNLNKKQIINLPKAVFFDLDNTLYEYQKCHDAGLSAVKLKAEQELSVDKRTFDKLYIKSNEEVKLNLKGKASSHNKLIYFKNMIEFLELGSQPVLALNFEQTYWRTFLNKAILFENVKELLDEFRIFSIPIIIITDLTTQIQFRKIVHLELDEYIDFVITSEEAGFDKPHPSPFKLAFKKLNFKKETTWMFGDDPVKDIKGSRDAIGAITFQKLHSGVKIGTNDSKPDFIFKTFKEVLSFVRNLNA